MTLIARSSNPRLNLPRIRKNPVVEIIPGTHAVDHEAAGTTDALAAIVLEVNWFLALADQIVIENVEHLEKGHVGIHVLQLVGPETALVLCVLLPPNMQGQLHL